MSAAPQIFRRVAVLMGGWSAEREVSLSSGVPCLAALRSEGYDAFSIDVGRDLAAQLAELRPEACFNALHGRYGEDGTVQGLLEIVGIPYTHSGVLASALAMNKEKTRAVARAVGVPVADGGVVARAEAAARHALEPPYVAKPIAEGSSVGVVIVPRGANRPPDAIARIPALDEAILVEEFIAGRELTCAVIEGRATGVIDIVPAAHLQFYDYESKYAAGGSEHILPADLPPAVTQAVQAHTLAMHNALGCRGVTRSDFRYDDATDRLVFLEINTQPGMTGTSLVPDLARHWGWSFERLVGWIMADASCDR